MDGRIRATLKLVGLGGMQVLFLTRYHPLEADERTTKTLGLDMLMMLADMGCNVFGNGGGGIQ